MAGTTPASGNYIYLESDPDDYIGEGRTYLYTQADSVTSVAATDLRLEVAINGDERWTANFAAMNTLFQLEAGYYGDLQRYPFHNPVKGGMDWGGEGRGCNTLSGWFVIDQVTFDGAALSSIDLRFEQHCSGDIAALRGEVHWDMSDTTSPPGPVVPPPAGLWEPPPGTTPATGNFTYLESEPGDFIGQGNSYLYTDADSETTVTMTGAAAEIYVNGIEDWHGVFEPMNTLSRVEVGYYGDLQRYRFHNPAKGGMGWTGETGGCNILTGWFVVDSVTYDGPNPTSIDLRFEQHCEGREPALNGQVRWSQ